MDAPFGHRQRSHQRTLYRLVALLILVAAVVGALYWLLADHPLQFDATVWRDTSVGEQELADLRWRMHEDLLARHTLVGMTRTQMIQLLGQPTPADRDTGSSIGYCIGLGEQWIPIDPYFLHVRFDDNGVVLLVEVIIS